MRPPPFTPSPKLTPEEKTRLAKRFRRSANLTDGGLLLGIASCSSAIIRGTICSSASLCS